MSSDEGYDGDELRALAVALDVIDPEDPDEWSGDGAAFAASVARGRRRLEGRGVATFARHGGADVVGEDAGMLRAFLAPDAVIEACVVDGSTALQREWYVGPEVTVVADPGAGEADAQELTTIDTGEVLADVATFLDVRGAHPGGEPVRIAGDAIDDFAGHPAPAHDAERPAPRLMNISAAWARDVIPGELQLLDAGAGGVWIVATVDREGASDADAVGDDDVELTPASRAEVVERLLGALSPGPPA